jgi:hypothetical protein
MTDSEGRMLTVDTAAATAPLIFSRGLLYDADGRVVVTATNPIAGFQGGLGFDAAGALCVTEL